MHKIQNCYIDNNGIIYNNIFKIIGKYNKNTCNVDMWE